MMIIIDYASIISKYRSSKSNDSNIIHVITFIHVIIIVFLPLYQFGISAFKTRQTNMGRNSSADTTTQQNKIEVDIYNIIIIYI